MKYSVVAVRNGVLNIVIVEHCASQQLFQQARVKIIDCGAKDQFHFCVGRNAGEKTMVPKKKQKS